MTTEIFTREEFENALPEGYWETAGMENGEYCYLIPINEDIKIFIRSSVRFDGLAAETGKDSIRAWLVDSEGKALGSKVQKWIQRVPGWEIRLLDMLRTLWDWAHKAGYCSNCNVPKKIFKVRKEGENKGRVFATCKQCNDKEQWKWLT